jgi:hypothetical protein
MMEAAPLRLINGTGPQKNSFALALVGQADGPAAGDILAFH